MKKTGILTSLLFLFSGVFFFIKNTEEKRLVEILEKEKLCLQQKVQNSTIKQKISDLEYTDVQLQKLNKTWENFIVFEHNSNINWYKHKDFVRQPNQDSLQAIIREDGGLGLITNYFGSQPIHHYKVQVKIGDISIDSSKVHQVKSQKVGRTLKVNESLFFEDTFAKDLVQQISLKPEADIEVILIGKDAFKHFTLNQDQKNAFKETWALHKMITI